MAAPQLLLRHIRNLVAREPSAAALDSALLQAFSLRHDENAFAALLNRHGQMVLGVARRVLRNEHDAEEIFQATFLLLARKATTIRRLASVSSWLHGVALRLAWKLRSQKVRRQMRERQAIDMRKKSANLEHAWQELQEALDQALQKLPAKYRTVLLLCYLEGRTQEEVAKQLGCPLGTVRSRLAQGRKLLANRLTKQGLAPAAGALAALLASTTPSQAVSALVQEQTLKAACLYVAGKAVAGLVSAEVAALVSAGLRAIAFTKIKTASVILALTGLFFGTISAGAYSLAGGLQQAPKAAMAQAAFDQPQQRSKTLSMANSGSDGEKKDITIIGRILDAQGKPAANAEVAAFGYSQRPRRGGTLSSDDQPVLSRTTADREGKFHLQLRQVSLAQFPNVALLAGLRNNGLGFRFSNLGVQQHDVEVKLTAEQVVRGRLLDLRGQPARGVAVRLAGFGRSEPRAGLPILFWEPPKPFKPWPDVVTTDEQGRFMLRGLNQEDGIQVEINDERFAHVVLPFPKDYKGTEVSFALTPAQIIEGRVLAADTGQPMPHAHLGVGASQEEQFFYGSRIETQADADAEGRFHVNPFAGRSFTVTAYPPEGQPYLTVMKAIVWPKGSVKQKVDVALPRGIVVHGKVTEQGSRKGVTGASVEYMPASSNPNERDEIITGWQSAVITEGDGSFQIVVLPGQGHLVVHGYPQDFVHLEIGSNQLANGKPGGSRMYPDGVAALDLGPTEKRKEVDISLRRGVTIRGHLVGPDDQTPAKVTMLCRANPQFAGYQRPTGAEVLDGYFELRGCDPDKTYPVHFLDAQHKTGVTIQVRGKDVGSDPIRVRLLPCGSAGVRFANGSGQPVKNRQMLPELILTPGPSFGDLKALKRGELSADAYYLPNIDRVNYDVFPTTDSDGRLKLPVLIPGATYRLGGSGADGEAKDFVAESGKNINLGFMTIQEK